MRENDGTVYIADGVELTDGRIFSGNLSYNKGMTLLHMIRFELDDDDLFFQVLQDYVEIYADSVARGVDFQAVLEDVSGMDFDDFFEQWYFGAGYPTFSASWGQVGSTLTLNVNQITSSTNTPLFKTSMEYKLSYSGGDTIVRVIHDELDEVYTFDIDEVITDVEIDPNNWVLNREGNVVKLVGIEESTQQFVLYPNPSSGRLMIQSASPESRDIQLEIYSSSGQVVYRRDFENLSPFSQQILDLTSLSPGMYFIRMGKDENTEVHKLILE